ncbi:MAG: S9 family peptidase [Candidatus Sericytochromatia bacterium]|nr:S9 family peptidase [Candidatus Sericytochromatia bacterium]
MLAGLTAPVLAQSANLVIDGIPEVPARVVERLAPYQNARAAKFLDWNPNGPGLIMATRFAETAQVHAVAHPGGDRRQLTFFKEPVRGGAYYPGKDRQGFLFSMDTGGAEFFQIYFYDQRTGGSTLLTDGRSRNTDPRWSHDGKSIAFSSNQRNGKDTDIRVMRLGVPGRSEVPGSSDVAVEGNGSYDILDWSPDNRQILVRKYVSANESHLYRCELATKKLVPLNDLPGKTIAYGAAQWSRDGKHIFYVSDEAGEFQNLRKMDLATGKTRLLTQGPQWDVSELDQSRDGKHLAYVANEDGISKLYVIDLKTGKPVSLPALPIGELSDLRFNPAGTELGFSLNTPKTSGDVFSIHLAKKAVTRWTSSEVGGLNTDDFVVPTLIHYPTFDSDKGKPRQIPAFVYKPQKAQGKMPVIISIHGGPEGQSVPVFSPMYQYYLKELGIAILEPNVRGSTGYGKTYLALDNGFQREDSVKDIGALLDWIATQPDLDASRVGVMGGSYGGYMTLATMCHYNSRIRAGMDMVGISNFVTFLEKTQDYRRDLRRVEYGDERDAQMRAFQLRISPTTNAHKITKPLFVGQGLNDPRVPVGEAEQIVKTVRSNGGKVWYLMAKDEGHGFAKKSNKDYYGRALSYFWEQHLLTPDASPAAPAVHK